MRLIYIYQEQLANKPDNTFLKCSRSVRYLEKKMEFPE